MTDVVVAMKTTAISHVATSHSRRIAATRATYLPLR
jgi:hypothetical protein